MSTRVQSSTIRRVTSVALGVLCLAQTTGCSSSWQPVTAPSPTEIDKDGNDLYRITTKTQRVVVVEKLRFRHDSMLGTRNGRTVGLPVSEVLSVDRRVGRDRAGVVAGLIVAGGLLLLAGGCVISGCF